MRQKISERRSELESTLPDLAIWMNLSTKFEPKFYKFPN